MRKATDRVCSPMSKTPFSEQNSLVPAAQQEKAGHGPQQGREEREMLQRPGEGFSNTSGGWAVRDLDTRGR